MTHPTSDTPLKKSGEHPPTTNDHNIYNYKQYCILAIAAGNLLNQPILFGAAPNVGKKKTNHLIALNEIRIEARADAIKGWRGLFQHKTNSSTAPPKTPMF